MLFIHAESSSTRRNEICALSDGMWWNVRWQRKGHVIHVLWLTCSRIFRLRALQGSQSHDRIWKVIDAASTFYSSFQKSYLTKRKHETPISDYPFKIPCIMSITTVLPHISFSCVYSFSPFLLTSPAQGSFYITLSSSLLLCVHSDETSWSIYNVQQAAKIRFNSFDGTVRNQPPPPPSLLSPDPFARQSITVSRVWVCRADPSLPVSRITDSWQTWEKKKNLSLWDGYSLPPGLQWNHVKWNSRP